jgi:hypothetical protein
LALPLEFILKGFGKLGGRLQEGDIVIMD